VCWTGVGRRVRGSDLHSTADRGPVRTAVLHGALHLVVQFRDHLHRRRGRAQPSAHLADRTLDDPRGRLPLGRGEPPASVLRPLPVPRDGPRRRLHVPRPPALRRLLGARPPPDVLLDRHLGWAQPTVRGAEVPDLHARRVRHHAPLDFRVVLQQRGREHGCLRGECEHARHDRVLGRCAAARDGGARVLDARAPDSDFRGVLNRVFGKASVVPVTHMAPGRPCRSADRRLRPPGGRYAEDGRLRNLPDQLRHAAGCRAGPVVGPRDPRDDLNGLRRVRVPRPSRPEAAHRLQLDRPHGVRPPRSIEPHGDRSPRRDLPALQPRDHHGDPLHARGFRETRDGHAGHPGVARPREGDAAILLRPRDRILRVARASGPQLVLVRVHGLRRDVRIAESRHDAAVDHHPAHLDRRHGRVLRLHDAAHLVRRRPGETRPTARPVALGFSLVVLGLATVLLLGFVWPDLVSLPTFVNGGHVYYAVEKSPWVSIPTLNVNYFLGADELSVVLVFLNSLLTPLALAISWDEHHRVAAFFAMFLFMETTINGVFLSLDLFQFRIFWEVG